MQIHINKRLLVSQILAVFLFSVFCLLFSISPARAINDVSQQILDLRKQIEELTKQAEQYRGNVTQKQKEANTLKKQIDILNNQINRLKTQISITDKQVGSAKLEIGQLGEQIFNAGEQINKERKAIGEIVNFLNQRDQLSLLAILLKNPGLSSFTDEMQQAQNLNNKLIGLLVDLKTEKESLEKNKTELEQKRTELEDLNKKQIKQKTSLDNTKTNKDSLLTQTKGQEAYYQKLLSETEKKEAQFFAELKGLEDQAIQSGAFIVHVTADSVPKKGSKILRWPYDDYYITQGYGCTSYARCGKVSGPYSGAPHNGVDIVGGFGEGIHPVAGGNVLASGFNNGFGNWVAVRHPGAGGLVSTYSHMRAPSGIANGTAVTTDSIIGYEGSTGNSSGSHVHLSVYQDFFTYINPKNGQLYFNYFEGSLNPLDYLP